jgi:hypothetical protein
MMPYELYQDRKDWSFYVKVIDAHTEGRTWKALRVELPPGREMLRNKIGQAHLLPGMSREKLIKVMALPTVEAQVRTVNAHVRAHLKPP